MCMSLWCDLDFPRTILRRKAIGSSSGVQALKAPLSFLGSLGVLGFLYLRFSPNRQCGARPTFAGPPFPVRKFPTQDLPSHYIAPSKAGKINPPFFHRSTSWCLLIQAVWWKHTKTHILHTFWGEDDRNSSNILSWAIFQEKRTNRNIRLFALSVMIASKQREKTTLRIDQTNVKEEEW